MVFSIFFKKILLCVLLEAIYGDLTAAVTGSVHCLKERTIQTRHAVEKLFMYVQ